MRLTQSCRLSRPKMPHTSAATLRKLATFYDRIVSPMDMFQVCLEYRKMHVFLSNQNEYNREMLENPVEK